MKKILFKILFIILISIVWCVISGCVRESVYAASVSNDINSIDDSKYPGVKAALQSVQARHPNWKINVYYTGIKWDDAINAEYTGHGASPKSLIYDTYSIGWRCPICGNKKYDVSGRYYCASKEAIKYMMDPRNSLDDGYIFQFQDLASSTGDREAIEQMVQGTFLNKPSYIDAIMEAAQTEEISPFHLVSRIKQEQGSSGIGAMNGYPYRTETGEFVIVYNLFNINVSGNDTNAGLLAGAQYAYEQGWTTAEASIKGGAKFLKEGYINDGQSTLYFQKFDVVDNGTTLYDHQYMQNIRAANDEGNTMYQSYRNAGILDSTFEFTIPLYENMPSAACPRPVDDYVGTINTELVSIDSVVSINGANYISGYINIAEWINGECRTPWETPKMTLKSTDGKLEYDIYVSYINGIQYYFDRNMEGVDSGKEYYIEVELQGERNNAPEDSKKQVVNLKQDKILTENANGKTIKIVDNKIIVSNGKYEGEINTELLDVNIIQNAAGDNYISGNINIAEWIDGSCYTPKAVPEIWIKSTDGNVNEKAYISYQDSIRYYFDKCIEDYDLSKQYYIEAKLVSVDNVAKEEQKIQKVSIKDQTIGEFKNKDITVIAKDNTFRLTYNGDINTELISLSLIQNAVGDNYISGYINIAEWIDGSCYTPKAVPEIWIKSTDGSFETMAYVSYQDGIRYYFDKCIEDFDTQKEYIIEAKIISPNNVAPESERTQKVTLPSMTVGKYGTVTVIARDGNLKISDSSLYYGTINTELYDINVIQNGAGDNYISGNIYIAEWVDGS